jgi:outer membrane translocation and assembly module TamA
VSSLCVARRKRTRRTAAPFAASLQRGAYQRRLGIMEDQPSGENGVVTTFETFDEARLHRNAPFSRAVRGMTGSAQYLLAGSWAGRQIPYQRPKAAGDFLTELHHAPVAFGLIVGEGNSRIVKEAQRVLFVRREAQEEIVSGSTRRTAAPFAASLQRGAYQRRLGIMEDQPSGENGVVTTFETFDEARLHRNAPFSRAVRGMTGSAQYLLAGSWAGRQIPYNDVPLPTYRQALLKRGLGCCR